MIRARVPAPRVFDCANTNLRSCPCEHGSSTNDPKLAIQETMTILSKTKERRVNKLMSLQSVLSCTQLQTPRNHAFQKRKFPIVLWRCTSLNSRTSGLDVADGLGEDSNWEPSPREVPPRTVHHRKTTTQSRERPLNGLLRAHLSMETTRELYTDHLVARTLPRVEPVRQRCHAATHHPLTMHPHGSR